MSIITANKVKSKKLEGALTGDVTGNVTGNVTGTSTGPSVPTQVTLAVLATMAAADYDGQMYLVTDNAAGAVLAYSTGTAWVKLDGAGGPPA